MTFIYYLSLGYVAATLLTSGIGHALGAARFRDLVRAHDIIPRDLVPATTLLVIAFELIAGAGALAVLLKAELVARAALLFAGCAVAGGAFACYIRRLLRRPGRVSSCGCSPLAGPLTPVAVVPACALLLLSALGLVAAGLGYGRALGVAYGLLGGAVALPLAWGVTLALLIIMLPASMPRPALNGRW
ncbi:MAG TPA: MauE/DoxX family redox-associated membrane protein [Pyrinomonadaceae bacterium]|jgi:hypothetical protein